ncbi:hypothetical protein ACFWMJ_23600 [Streptomyces hawaiiensis]|uniref:hypothetical protein n=1 Tax=Streptomyces hawaiiensis TaxID=67305 RepID=UPI0036541407
MSARETLTTTLTNLLARTRSGRMDAHRAEAERLVEEALREGAHGLAERIRNSKRLRDHTDDHMGDCNEAADEIDPEVQQ